MSLQAERAGLELSLDCSDRLPAVFCRPRPDHTGPDQHVHNAVKFNTRGKLTVSAFQDREQIVFVVRDTGVGIAKKVLDRSLKAFTKMTGPRRRRTAWGLSTPPHDRIHGDDMG